MDLDGVLEGLEVEAEGFDGAVVGFLGVVVCLVVVEGGGFIFFGGSLGIFFFCSGIVKRLLIVQHRSR